ncbi:MAG: bacteriohemerythrin [Spirochaetes bacterium]|nr:bacteriohemerythrin [Spirochaetota bacterium]
MPFIIWNKEYSVGIKSMDEQHYKLVDLANNLYEAIKSGRKNEALIETFKGLVEYVQVHFNAEEKLMEDNDYPFNQLLKHKQEHRDLIKKIKELFEKAKAGSATVNLEMLNFLRDWIMIHIAESDKKYGPFLNSKGVS